MFKKVKAYVESGDDLLETIGLTKPKVTVLKPEVIAFQLNIHVFTYAQNISL